MLDKNAISIDIKVGNAVRIRRTWRSPYAARLGVVSAIEPNDFYGTYIIEFEDGLHFRYQRQEFEPTETTYIHEPAVRKSFRLGRLLFP
jgi:hypothetical protein